MKARKIEMKDLGEGWAYKDIMLFIAGYPEQGQVLNYLEVKRRGDLADEIEKSNGAAMLSEEHHALLWRLAKTVNWPLLAQNQILRKQALDNIRTFMTDLENAESVVIEAH